MCWGCPIESFISGGFAHTKHNVSFSPFHIFPEAELSQNYYFFSHSCYLWEMWHSGNGYCTANCQMLTPYGLVRNSFMNVRYGRGSSGYFHLKNCVGMKDPRTSKVFFMSPANLLQCKLWGFLCALCLQWFWGAAWGPGVHGMSVDGLWTLQPSVLSTSGCS